MYFEHVLVALQGVVALHPGSFSPLIPSLFLLSIQCDRCLFPFPMWGLITELPGFARRGRSLHLGAGCQ